MPPGLPFVSVSGIIYGTRFHWVLFVSECPVYMYIMAKSSTHFPVYLSVWYTSWSCVPFLLLYMSVPSALYGIIWSSVYLSMSYIVWEKVQSSCSKCQYLPVRLHSIETQRSQFWVSVISDFPWLVCSCNRHSELETTLSVVTHIHQQMHTIYMKSQIIHLPEVSYMFQPSSGRH